MFYHQVIMNQISGISDMTFKFCKHFLMSIAFGGTCVRSLRRRFLRDNFMIQGRSLLTTLLVWAFMKLLSLHPAFWSLHSRRVFLDDIADTLITLYIFFPWMNRNAKYWNKLSLVEMSLFTMKCIEIFFLVAFGWKLYYDSDNDNMTVIMIIN